MKTTKMSYPVRDDQFKDVHISKVKKTSNGWDITRSDGWSFYIPSGSPIAPKEGMPTRFYGKGIGFSVRGVYLDGVKVFYRTEDEEKEHHEIQTYGADATEWLRRWDSGKICWTLEMGGLGPGYEQCIHITCAEILRHMLAKQYDASKWAEADIWKQVQDETETMSHENKVIKLIGLSGAQWGAALQLAAKFYMDGPRSIMADARVKDRHIQVSCNFPRTA